MLDLYSPGKSFLHKMSPAPKMLVLMVAATLLFLNDSLAVTLAAMVAVLLLYPLAQLSFKQAWQQLRPLLWIFAVFFALQWWLAGLEQAAYVVLRLAALILLASLVTLTTRSSDMIDTITTGLGFLKPIGVNPAKVGLAISLALRFIPVLAQVTQDVREAQKTRGLERSVIAVAMPVAIRTLKMADDISDAIESRGYRP
ncbi:energy-coupling factor transporter transmembrane protein EcfT [Shimia thalassica]|uniref:energy-coupling factor transporter transmembrane component T family protein n=1 Tax=Shimia thalassica TaxID=1715693 RepID=UPI000C07EB04|nr:energy-coupling factor transporter transmembrane protein EcfT [Shimia thalassica]PHO05908.1 cobalt ABC transporter permease [Rhodobacteraceae bacterium 4F10]MDO6480084.1 energy-coupling factor transporter transmembrane protein EcfT [Shimia thalassica]MDO6484149.1 energy-coupling factor transporter transmembrane protein EcfT [Shimia thalassica]MDO6799578.1 energy-coupling factor transporter transmembrane protein EcfT [Shimia thalassica]MDP2581493.1 energy-coupling factor transporter transmem